MKVHAEVCLKLVFEMIGGFDNRALARFGLADVVGVAGVVRKITERFTDLHTARHNVHTRTCKHKNNNVVFTWQIEVLYNFNTCTFIKHYLALYCNEKVTGPRLLT